MNDTMPVPPIPTKQSILLQREAYAKGLRHAGYSAEGSASAARLAYPMPAITRPRVVTLSDGQQYRRVDGTLEFRERDVFDWRESYITDEKIATLANLLANPTETVPDE